MSKLSMKDLAKKIGDIDFTMLSTKAEGGEIAARPMSNNGDVEYDGDSYFFTYEKARLVHEIKRDSRVGLSLQGKAGLLGKPPIFIAIEANAELIYEKAALQEHWNPNLERWFDKGIDNPRNRSHQGTRGTYQVLGW